jgi:hypothetical protein
MTYTAFRMKTGQRPNRYRMSIKYLFRRQPDIQRLVRTSPPPKVIELSTVK